MNQLRVARRRPTMHDVAHEAGVSLKTVSRVVNREGGVRPDLVDRVETAIDNLGYQRHDSARQLRTGGGASKTIGFVQVDVANPFFSAIFRGIEDVATEHGYQVIAGSSDGDSDQQDAVLRALIARRVDGIIIVPSGDRLELLTAEMERNTSVVFLDLEPRAGIAGDLVRSDHRGGARTITRHLIEHGHERIAFIGDDPSIFSAEERFQGFAEAMTESGLAVEQRWVKRELSDRTRTRAAVTQLLETLPGRFGANSTRRWSELHHDRRRQDAPRPRPAPQGGARRLRRCRTLGRRRARNHRDAPEPAGIGPTSCTPPTPTSRWIRRTRRARDP